ncbi:MAG: hypothetical protein R2711_16370 [Acidimicrobiales bacterium]
MTLAPAPGSPTPPIDIAGGAAEATGRLSAPVVLLDDGFLDLLSQACADIRLDPGERAEASRDWWPLAMVWATEGKVGQVAGAIARPPAPTRSPPCCASAPTPGCRSRPPAGGRRWWVAPCPSTAACCST